MDWCETKAPYQFTVCGSTPCQESEKKLRPQNQRTDGRTLGRNNQAVAQPIKVICFAAVYTKQNKIHKHESLEWPMAASLSSESAGFYCVKEHIKLANHPKSAIHNLYFF